MEFLGLTLNVWITVNETVHKSDLTGSKKVIPWSWMPKVGYERMTEKVNNAFIWPIIHALFATRDTENIVFLGLGLPVRGKDGTNRKDGTNNSKSFNSTSALTVWNVYGFIRQVHYYLIWYTFDQSLHCGPS